MIYICGLMKMGIVFISSQVQKLKCLLLMEMNNHFIELRIVMVIFNWFQGSLTTPLSKVAWLPLRRDRLILRCVHSACSRRIVAVTPTGWKYKTRPKRRLSVNTRCQGLQIPVQPLKALCKLAARALPEFLHRFFSFRPRPPPRPADYPELRLHLHPKNLP